MACPTYSVFRDMISARKRIGYALGYIELGVLDAAREELAAIDATDARRPDVLLAWLELSMAAGEWEEVSRLAPELITGNPTDERPWIAWAYALRERQHITEARDVLLRGERLIAKPTVLVDYNLACYFTLLGDLAEARRRLQRVFASDPAWRAEAADDPDLTALHPL